MGGMVARARTNAIGLESKISAGTACEVSPIDLLKGVTGYGVSAFSLSAGEDGAMPYLTGMYQLTLPSAGWHGTTPGLYERAAWQVQQAGTDIGSGRCHVVPNRLLVKVPKSTQKERVLDAFARHLQAFLYGCTNAFAS
ncbi:MAG TPA: hypothetical protein VMB05_10935 [Solirubrobacteraceae bacterium]|nr:hypothetical protein [Solirubrobacteraceae bacterium]